MIFSRRGNYRRSRCEGKMVSSGDVKFEVPMADIASCPPNSISRYLGGGEGKRQRTLIWPVCWINLVLVPWVIWINVLHFLSFDGGWMWNHSLQLNWQRGMATWAGCVSTMDNHSLTSRNRSWWPSASSSPFLPAGSQCLSDTVTLWKRTVTLNGEIRG